MARILIAEDDPLIASFLEKGLRANGFATLVAEDGEKAERLEADGEFDLLILDMGLPGREGFHVLQELRARGKRMPVLVLTGRRERDVVACLEAGADDYMTKPFSSRSCSHVSGSGSAADRTLRVRRAHGPAGSGSTCGRVGRRSATRTVELTAREFALLEMLAPARRPGPEPRAAALPRLGLLLRPGHERRRTSTSTRCGRSSAPDVIETVRGAGYRLPTR